MNGGQRELRFGLVLYGGVSLAVYMHGATTELHRLVRASALTTEHDGGGPDDAPALRPSERVWRQLLAAKADADEHQVATRVVVDVISGTSAGGINGVYLAKALAHDLSQDHLRDVWFDRADVARLLRRPRVLGRRVPLPWPLRVPWVVATLPWAPALEGDGMTRWLHDALERMDAGSGGSGTLVPPGLPLQLFVTTTDFHGYTREVRGADPPVVYDRRHRHVMAFRYGDGHDDFGAGRQATAALALAARATACFPGAFPPVDFADFARALGAADHAPVDAGERPADGPANGTGLDLAELQERLFRHYPLAGADAGQAYFVDGGVLDNRPFGHAIAAIRGQPAGGEVDRYLLYIDPDPSDPRQTPPAQAPRPLTTVFGALSGLPRHEPILDELLAVGRSNEHVAQVRAVIETSWTPVTALVEDTLADEDLTRPPADPADERLHRWRDRIHQRAITDAGLGYGLYVRAKIAAVIDTWAATVCRLVRYPEDSTQASFVRAVLHRWAGNDTESPDADPQGEAGNPAHNQDLFQRSTAPTPEQVGFLRDFDLDYGERRLMFLIAGLSWWYQPWREPDFAVPGRGQLDAAKQRLYEAVGELRAVRRGEGLPAELAEAADACFGERRLAAFVYQGAPGVDRFLGTASHELTALVEGFRAHLRERLDGFGARVYRDVHGLSAAWHPEARTRLLVRYLGFPVWDALLFPLQSIADVGERDRVDVVRASPADVSILTPPDDGPKLAGARLHHFGAFFTRSGREQDYLWGRLDTAERLVGVLLGTGDHDRHDAWCRRLFAAILDEEAPALEHARDLVTHLRGQLATAP